MDGLSSVYARNCSVRRIDKPSSAAFLNENHKFGDASCRYRYGLFVERSTGSSEQVLPSGSLVAVAQFSNARRWVKDGKTISSYEWVRYASLKGLRVVGGMSKLLNAFVEEVHPDDVMSYAEQDCPDGGEAYLAMGFESEGLVIRPEFTNIKFRKRFSY